MMFSVLERNGKHVLCVSIAFYDEYRSLIGCATCCLFCDTAPLRTSNTVAFLMEDLNSHMHFAALDYVWTLRNSALN